MDALIVVDLQRDFRMGGALAVPRSEEIVPVIHGMLTEFPVVVASRDWHPVDHCSFRLNGGEWPRHCEAGQPGADVDETVFAHSAVVSKGYDPDREAYSAFDGVLATGETLYTYFERVGVVVPAADPEHRRGGSITVVGLALDYCVKATAIDALKLGVPVFVPLTATRAITAESGGAAIHELQRAGVHVVSQAGEELPSQRGVYTVDELATRALDEAREHTEALAKARAPNKRG